MATLDKLAIRGIRSFDDKSVNIIQFQTPITVIVGYNGSGKTSILESILYATTGDMPPNTKGGAFIHDPKIAGSKEVKAQVRLRFYNQSQTRMNVVRNVQVSQKKTGNSTALTLKTLEGLLQVDDPEVAKNKRATLSTKCAELDEEVPNQLGVSRSILQNVVFCHQEDSNWPLSEASVLKKKFDDIFDATKWTKAIDNIKVIRKERTNDLKVSKAELEALKTDRDRSEQLKAKKAKLGDSLAEKKERYETLGTEIRRVTKENKQFYDSAVKFREIVNQAETLEEKRRLHQQNRESLRISMTELQESDDELQRRKDSFQDHLSRQRGRRDDFAKRIDKKRSEIEQIERQYSTKLSEKGALESDKKHHERAISKREEEVRAISLELGIRGFDVAGLSDAQIADFKHRLDESVRAAENALKDFRAKSGEKEQDFSNKYQELRTERSSKVSSRDTTSVNAKRIKERMKQATDELEDVNINESDISHARETLEDDEKKLRRIRKELEDANYDEQLSKKNGEIRQLDERREELTLQLNELNRYAEFRAKLDLKRRESEEKKGAADDLVKRHAAAYKTHTGQEAKVESFDRLLTTSISSKDRDVAAAEREEAEKTRSVQHLESALSIARGQLSSKRNQLSQLQTEVKAFLKDEDDANSVDDVITAAEEEVRIRSDELSSDAQAQHFFQRILKVGQSQHECQGCGRGIKDNELPAFEKYVLKKINQLSADGRKQNEQDLQEWKGVLAKARGLLPKEATAKTLQEVEIPKLEKEIEGQSAELGKKSDEAEHASSVVRDLREQQQQIAALKRAAQDISRLVGEAETLRKEAATLESDLSSSGSTQTGDQVQSAIGDMADSIRTLKREANIIAANRDSKRNELNNTERQFFRSQQAVAQKEQELGRKASLQKRVDELKGEWEELKEAERRLEDEIEGLAPRIRKTKEELEAVKEEHAREDEKLSGELSGLQSKARELQETSDRVKRYIDGRGEQRLQDCIDKIKDLQSQTSSVQAEIKEIEAQISTVDKDLNESNATERNILDNLRYRQLGRDLLHIEEDLNKLDLDAASKARKDFESKYHDQKQIENSLNGEAQHLSGEIKSLDEQIRTRDEELKTDYKDIHTRFSKKLVEVKTSELANADLERYGKALEQSVLKYHGYKMAEVNESIRLLWARTYQGSDIDSISIESDNEKVGNRSYNYRVTMMKDNVKLDMRGRCSAGQKVLASTLIRLALADSFGCRFLALDEPTLCLDHETVSALASSLGELIKERPKMQLLIVTHDSDFLSMLSQSIHIDSYYRVSRDNAGKSLVEKMRIR